MDYVKNALRNKQQITYKQRTLKENHGNVIFSFIVINLVSKGILHFFITNGLSTDCSTKEFIHKFFRQNTLKKITKMLNASIFSFIILNLVKKGILDFHVTTATDICMKDVIHSCLRRAL